MSSPDSGSTEYNDELKNCREELEKCREELKLYRGAVSYIINSKKYGFKQRAPPGYRLTISYDSGRYFVSIAPGRCVFL